MRNKDAEQQQQQVEEKSPSEDEEQPWSVESQSAWIGPSNKLEILVPVTEQARFLYLQFDVLSGSCIDFEVMLEQPDEQTAERLYGPSRRAHSLRTVLPLPRTGVAYATFDNSSSWITSVEIKYKLRLSSVEPEDSTTLSRLRSGDYVGRDGRLADAEARELEAAEDIARQALRDARPCEIRIAAGVQEEVEMRVDEPTDMCTRPATASACAHTLAAHTVLMLCCW